MIGLWTAQQGWQASTTRQYIRACESSPTLSTCTSLTHTAKELDSLLQSKGSKLTIVLLPFLSALYPQVEAPAVRALQLAPNQQTDFLFGTAADLRRTGVDVFMPIKTVVDSTRRKCEDFSADGHHYSAKTDRALAREILRHARGKESNPDEQLVIAGDSYAVLVSQYMGGADGLKVVHRAGSADRIAFQLSQLPDDFLDPGSHIYWIITSSYLNEQASFPPWMPKVSSPGLNGRIVGKLMKCTPLAGQKLLTSPYADALAAYKFQPQQGEPILLLGQVMQARQLTATYYWYGGVSMSVQIMPWDEAEQNRKELKTMQIIDAIGDPSLPAYFADDFIFFSE